MSESPEFICRAPGGECGVQGLDDEVAFRGIVVFPFLEDQLFFRRPPSAGTRVLHVQGLPSRRVPLYFLISVSIELQRFCGFPFGEV